MAVVYLQRYKHYVTHRASEPWRDRDSGLDPVIFSVLSRWGVLSLAHPVCVACVFSFYIRQLSGPPGEGDERTTGRHLVESETEASQGYKSHNLCHPSVAMLQG